MLTNVKTHKKEKCDTFIQPQITIIVAFNYFIVMPLKPIL